jgi:hypothetical protein
MLLVAGLRTAIIGAIAVLRWSDGVMSLRDARAWLLAATGAMLLSACTQTSRVERPH